MSYHWSRHTEENGNMCLLKNSLVPTKAISARIVGVGGSSSSWATTMIDKEIEWSATGLKDAILAGDSVFAESQFMLNRTASRLTHMQV